VRDRHVRRWGVFAHRVNKVWRRGGQPTTPKGCPSAPPAPMEEIKTVMKRQGATPKGLNRRIGDLELGRVSDPRVERKVKVTLPTLLTALIGAMVTKARSLRAVEQRTAQMACKLGSFFGIDGRIADNTFGKVIPRLRFAQLVRCLHRLIKAEHRRGNLHPTVLSVGAVAIDGKNVATLRWHDLCRVLQLDPNEATAQQVRQLLSARYPEAQLCEPEAGHPYALMRMHTVTLISSKAAVCVHQRPIEGHTNEIGAMPALIDELKATYGRTRLFQLITTDAGNTSLAAATRIVEADWDYFAQIKSIHGDLHAEALRVLQTRRKARAHATVADKQNGLLVTYHAWCFDLTDAGFLDWTHARQLVRVRRTTENPTTGQTTVGDRYYVTNRSPAELSPTRALNLSRAHWRCEDETHWTADAELQEDRRRLAWSRHPHGTLVVSVLRMIALSLPRLS
jgi:hypothetical protein